MKNFKELREKYRSKFPSSLVAATVKIAIDMGGNMTGAYKKIEKMKRGLGDDPMVADALKQANESVNEGVAQVEKMFPRDRAWKNLVRKYKRDIDSFQKGRKDLPKRVEDELLDWGLSNGEIKNEDDAEDFIDQILNA